jgi:hypothetical protein
MQLKLDDKYLPPPFLSQMVKVIDVRLRYMFSENIYT